MREMRVILVSLLLMGLSASLAPHVANTGSLPATPDLGGSVLHPKAEPDCVPVGESFSCVSEDQVHQGLLGPLLVEQRGYVVSGGTTARTDLNPSPTTDIPLDTDNSWVFSQTSVEVHDLERMYVVNGTFDEGYPGSNDNPDGTVEFYPLGWTAISNSSNAEQIQVASYEQTVEEYVTVENQGEKEGPSGKKYRHYAGTSVFWKQTYSNIPQVEDFVLGFSYRYLRGPLGAATPGACSLRIALNNQVFFYKDLTELESRNTWYDVEDLAINYPLAPSQIDITVGLFIDDTMLLEADGVYGDDDKANGIVNTVYITAHVDDITLTGAQPPSFDQVAMQYEANETTVDIEGSQGSGTATIQLTPVYSADPLTVRVLCNSSVRFFYEVRALAHRFINSTYTTDNTAVGAAYEAVPNGSVNLITFTYHGSQGDYENFTISAYYPNDWENLTVYDPFLTDVTSHCYLQPGMVEISGSILSRLGWWEFIIEAPNYARDVSSQIYDSDTSSWTFSDNYRVGNLTRGWIDIGTSEDDTYLDTFVNFTWYLPNGSIWSSASFVPDSFGPSTSNPQAIEAENSSAGEWVLLVEWTNGTEVAVGSVSFTVTHSGSLEVAVAEIEVSLGEVISNFVRFRDDTTDRYLTEEYVTITANWTSSPVQFDPNLVRNRYEADFDTSDLPYGISAVIVTATSMFHDTSFDQFNVILPYPTNASILGNDAGFVEADLLEATSITARYTRMDNSGVEDANLSIYYSGPTDGLQWEAVPAGGNGNYTIEFTGVKSGIYSIDVLFSKYVHEDAQTSFLLLVGELGSELTLLNGTSQSIEYGESFQLFLFFENATGYGLENATVTAQSTYGDDPITIDDVIDLREGYYSVSITPSDTMTFTIVIEAFLVNYETQFATFTLTVTEIEMTLTYDISASSIAIGRNVTATLELLDRNSEPVSGALLEFIDPPSSAVLGSVIVGEAGIYVFNVSFTGTGTYVIAVRASKSAYRNTTTSLTIVATKIPTSLSVSSGLSSASISFGSRLQLDLLYIRTDLNANVSGAVIEIQGEGLSSLTLSVTEVALSYRLAIRSNSTGRWVLTFTASRTDHNSDMIQFTLDVLPVSTELTGSTPLESVYISRTYELPFSYTMDNGTGVAGADVIGTGFGSDFVVSRDDGEGAYTLLLTPEEVGSYSVKIMFSKVGFSSRVYTLSFAVTLIPASLSTSEGISSSNLEYGAVLDLDLLYIRTDLNMSLSSANISVQAADLSDLTLSVMELPSSYRVRIMANSTGTWVLTFTASKSFYSSDSIKFTLTVQTIATELSGATPLQSVFVSREYSLPFRFALLNGSGIADASISKSGLGSDFISVADKGGGDYSVLLAPGEEGSFSVVVTFSKLGHRSRDYAVSFTVVPIPVEVDVEFLSWSQGLPLVIVARVVEADMGAPVDGAIVRFQLYSESALIAQGTLSDVGNGVYRAQVDADWVDDNTLKVSISVSKDGYEQESSSVVSVIPIPNLEVQAYQSFVAYGVPGILVFILAIIGLQIYRWREKKQQQLRQENDRIRQRFMDAQNIMGILAMHKSSGLPIYSRAMKPGIDEAILSAFISAVSHFRSEFGLEEVMNYTVVPISDVVRVVPTENLLCAMVTVTPPSDEQEERLVQCARAAHERFDELYSDAPVEFRDELTAQIFDQLYEQHLDGYLLEEYQFNSDMVGFDELKCVKDGAESLTNRFFRLIRLARSMKSCGYSETIVYRKIWDALESGLLERVTSPRQMMSSDWSAPPEP